MRCSNCPIVNQYFFLFIKGVLLGFTVSIIALPYIPLKDELIPSYYDTETSVSIIDPGFHDKSEFFHENEDTKLVEHLYEKVKVLCWILTHPGNHDSKAQHVKLTWGKRCNILIFMSSQQDESLPAIALDVQEGRNYLRYKTSEALRYVYTNYLHQADWFLKADDDTYVVMENLRYMLSLHSPDEPIYFGRKFKPFVEQGYMSGGAGYVLSKEALRRFVEVALDKHKTCLLHNGSIAEDVFVGKCLYGVGVKTGDSRDSLGRNRFHPFMTETMMFGNKQPKWFQSYIDDKPEEGLECCSDTTISFHYVPTPILYGLEYLIYHVRPFGIFYNYNALNNTIM